MSVELFKTRLGSRRAELNGTLLKALDRRFLMVPGEESLLYGALRYALEASAKRLRPAMLLEACTLVDGDSRNAMHAALAIEFIHTYSLIHDDLPGMDNAETRRGRPTVHRAFGEGMAILAGDALLTEAFALLAAPPLDVPAERALRALAHIAEGAGLRGMVRGQELDLVHEHKRPTPAELDLTHQKKTAALFVAALLAGAELGGACAADLAALRRYGEAMGLAFQIRDDLQDLDPNSPTGKDKGLDAARDKATYPALHGVDESVARLNTLLDHACTALAPFGDKAGFFLGLAQFLRTR